MDCSRRFGSFVLLVHHCPKSLFKSLKITCSFQEKLCESTKKSLGSHSIKSFFFFFFFFRRISFKGTDGTFCTQKKDLNCLVIDQKMRYLAIIYQGNFFILPITMHRGNLPKQFLEIKKVLSS